MKNLLFILLATMCFSTGNCQKRTILLDFEDKPSTEGWFKDNDNVVFSLNENKKEQMSKKSKVCLNVKWNNIPSDKPWCWFTDLKIDSLKNPAMAQVRKEFGGDIWFSFWCKTVGGDTLWIQPLMLTHDHKGKWGAKELVPVSSSKWVFMKFQLSKLEYEKWGAGADVPDLTTDDIKCFEVGLRNGVTSPNGFINAFFDNMKITNYEPYK